MGGYGQLDKLIIAEIEETLRRNAAEIAAEAARRYRQLADAVERNLFGWLDLEDIDPDLVRRPLTPADVLAAMTPGQALIALSNAHFALPGAPS